MSNLFVDAIKNYKIENNEWMSLITKNANEFLIEEAAKLKSVNRYFGNPLLLKLMHYYTMHTETNDIVKKDSSIFRGRIYCEPDADSRYKDVSENLFKGYDEKNSFVSPNPAENRCSPESIPYLYVAKQEDTAIYEINPSINDYVSIAEIKVKQNLKILDLNIDVSPAAGQNEERKKWFNLFMIAVSNLFSTPVREDEKENYLLCQYISEFVNLLGFDGIMYKSSKLCYGINYVIFDCNKCKAINSKLCQITNINYKFFCNDELKK